jgi:4'-phosphopantetheinyl transferase
MALGDISWSAPPSRYALGEREVHIWRAWLEPASMSAQAAMEYCSDDERARADRFRFERDRGRFLVGRGVLRALLGRYLGAEPSALRFVYNPHGKPSLEGRGNEESLRFNVGHSHQLGVYALTRGRPVGVDVEWMKRLPDAGKLAARFFSERERGSLAALPADQVQEAFYLCWTRKEAYLKALGTGLATTLGGFSVSLAPGEPARLVHVEREPDEAGRWSLASFAAAPGYLGSVAVRGGELQLTGHDFR